MKSCTHIFKINQFKIFVILFKKGIHIELIFFFFLNNANFKFDVELCNCRVNYVVSSRNRTFTN
jgi:hypothetical protein